MKFSENWLRELVEIKADRAELAHALTMAGLEVEELTPLGDGLAGVVVAEIVAAGKHPEADRLQVCKVDAGQGEPLQIVCGAPNARVGIKVPLAMVGARLPGGVAIKAAKLRGVESFGAEEAQPVARSAARAIAASDTNRLNEDAVFIAT